MATFVVLFIAGGVIIAVVAAVDASRRPYRKAKSRFEHRRYEREISRPTPEYRSPRRRLRRIRRRVLRTTWNVTHPIRATRHWWHRRPHRRARSRSV